jgi:hypothetical protein
MVRADFPIGAGNSLTLLLPNSQLTDNFVPAVPAASPLPMAIRLYN